MALILYQTLFWLLLSHNPHITPVEVGPDSSFCRWGNESTKLLRNLPQMAFPLCPSEVCPLLWIVWNYGYCGVSKCLWNRAHFWWFGLKIRIWAFIFSLPLSFRSSPCPHVRCFLAWFSLAPASSPAATAGLFYVRPTSYFTKRGDPHNTFMGGIVFSQKGRASAACYIFTEIQGNSVHVQQNWVPIFP